jgi:hypothetical protein
MMTTHDDQNERGLYALHATALGLLLTGIVGDGDRVSTEIDRILAAGPKVVSGVMGFMAAHAAEGTVARYGGIRAAVEAVRAELDAATRAAEGDS